MNNKLNARISNRFRFFDRLTLTTEAYFTHNQLERGRPDYRPNLIYSTRYADYLALRDADGNPIRYDGNYRVLFTDTLAGGMLLDWARYPATDYEEVTFERTRQELNANVALNYKLFDFLEFSASYQHQIQNGEEEIIENEHSYESRNRINSYSHIDPRSGMVVRDVVPFGGLYRSNSSSVNSHTFRGQANLRKFIGVHSINAIFGAEARESGTFSTTYQPRYGYFEDPLRYTVIDVITRYPHLITGNLSSIGGGSALNRKSHRFVSFYGNASYSYLGRYTLSGSMRRDGSNIFGASTNDKWKPLWSAGLGWRISDELFYEWNAFPVVRLTATYGYSGNVDLSRTSLPAVITGTDNQTRFRWSRVTQINNPSLRWEQNSQTNIRLDVSNRMNRVSFTLGYFLKKGTDLYGPEPYDLTTWGRTRELVRNVANMKTEGVEIEVHSLNVKRDNFQWSTDFYVTWTESIVTKYHSNNDYSPYYNVITSGKRIWPVEGMPPYAIAAYEWGGLDNKGMPQGYLDGELSTDYSAIMAAARTSGAHIVGFGSTSPTYFGSLINSLNWKNWYVGFNINYRLGYSNRKEGFSGAALISNGTPHGDYWLRWQNPGDELITDVPAFTYPANPGEGFYSVSSANIFRADNIRLDYINVRYKVNTTQWRYPFRKLEIQIGMQNVGILWRKNKFGVDPDYPHQVRPTRMVNIGLNTSF